MTSINFKLATPSVPNFITVMVSERGKKQDGFNESPKVSLAQLSDEQLNSIAEDWKKALFENAERQRKDPKMFGA